MNKDAKEILSVFEPLKIIAVFEPKTNTTNKLAMVINFKGIKDKPVSKYIFDVK